MRAIDSSLITVTYNSSSALRRFWNDVELEGVEWIVVDNASNDDTVDVAAELGARVIRLRENIGFGKANNIGFQAAGGDFIGFVNPDVAVDIAGLPELAAVADRSAGLVAPQLMNPDGSVQPNGRGYPFLWAKVINRLTANDERYLLVAPDDRPRLVSWVMGAALFARRREFARIGPWDPRFFIYYEDADISLRAWREGIPTSIVPTVRWTHGWARETQRFRLQPWRREIESMTTFYSRYPELLTTRGIAARRHRRMAHDVFGGDEQ